MQYFMKVVRKYAEEENCGSDDNKPCNVEDTSEMRYKIVQKHIMSRFGVKKKDNCCGNSI